MKILITACILSISATALCCNIENFKCDDDTVSKIGAHDSDNVTCALDTAKYINHQLEMNKASLMAVQQTTHVTDVQELKDMYLRNDKALQGDLGVQFINAVAGLDTVKSQLEENKPCFDQLKAVLSVSISK